MTQLYPCPRRDRVLRIEGTFFSISSHQHSTGPYISAGLVNRLSGFQLFLCVTHWSHCYQIRLFLSQQFKPGMLLSSSLPLDIWQYLEPFLAVTTGILWIQAKTGPCNKEWSGHRLPCSRGPVISILSVSSSVNGLKHLPQRAVSKELTLHWELSHFFKKTANIVTSFVSFLKQN